MFDSPLEKLRLRLAASNAVPQLAILGLLVGLLAGTVILLFRQLVEGSLHDLLDDPAGEAFERVEPIWRFVLPTAGGILLGLIWQALPAAHRAVGVVHVLERLSYHQGYLPWRNAVAQFFGASLSLLSGHSVGREGPGAHLGAAGGSLLGQWLRLPHNSIRTLVACGVAAAIAASFNTPLAGVVFAMEVVMMEYSVNGFIPVLLAAVSATYLIHQVYGDAPAFSLPPLADAQWNPLFILALGVFIGLLAALFVHGLRFCARRSEPLAIGLRFTLAGFVTGIVGVAVPEVLGIGYDTVNAVLVNGIAADWLVVILAVKLLLTALGLGLGLPAGLIGPSMVLGAVAAGVLTAVLAALQPVSAASQALYGMLGAGAMMSAVLHAPFAALTALLELTADPGLILPGMLVIVVAHLITDLPPLRAGPVFLTLLRARGLDYRQDLIRETLRREGVARLMHHDFVEVVEILGRAELEAVLTRQPRWIVVTCDPPRLRDGESLRRYLDENPETLEIDLTAIPGERIYPAVLSLRADLEEAYLGMERDGASAFFIHHPTTNRRVGLLEAGDVEHFLRGRDPHEARRP